MTLKSILSCIGDARDECMKYKYQQYNLIDYW